MKDSSTTAVRSPARRLVRAAFDRAERAFDAAFDPQANPLHQLGALGFFFYWVVAVSGIYLYAFFDTGVTEAYSSVQRITVEQWYAGGIMRSLHRYASDALVVVVVLHLLREWSNGRLRGPRWFAWVTGIVLVWFMFASGISGYWVVWDRLAQYVALATSEWLDALGLFGQPIARNFVHDSTLSSRFFTLMVFIHIAVPLVMLLVMWIHIHRLSLPQVNPPRRLALGSLGALLALSLLRPALSQGPADLDRVPVEIGLDWFYLAPLALKDYFSGGALWIAIGAATLLLLVLPWLPPRRKRALARVNLAQCNGCARCAADCPYGAITMRPRSDGEAFAQEAAVSAELCVGCGICVGACPTATPFRRRGPMEAGIELEAPSIASLRERCVTAAAELSGRSRVLVLGCQHGPRLEALSRDDIAAVELPCVGMLPPSFFDFLITRRHVDGVMVAGCADGACHERLGIRWTRDRIDRQRDPYLRERVPRDRLTLYFGGRDRASTARRHLEAFCAQLGEAGAAQPPAAGGGVSRAEGSERV